MPTVPRVTMMDDWRFEIVKLGATVLSYPLNEALACVEGWVVPAPTVHKIRDGLMEVIGTSKAADFIRAQGLENIWLVRMIPYEDTTHELWAWIEMMEQTYTEEGKYDSIKCKLVQVGTHLKRMNYHCEAGYNPWGVGGILGLTMDDFLHYLIRDTVWDPGNIDINGAPRTWPASWGTLTVAADHSAHASTADDIWTQEGYVLPLIDDVATQNDIVWELKPTLNPVAATISWTFDTEYPYGTDRTSGTGAVFIEDQWGVLPTGSSYVDWSDYGNSMQGDLGWYAWTDAAEVAARGRWESIGWGDNDVELDLLLQQRALKVGQKETLNLTPVTQQMQWMSKWEVGDLVRHANTRLGLAEENARIAAVHFTFTRNSPVMALEIQWGERQPSLISKTGPGSGSPYDSGPGTPGVGGDSWWAYDPDNNALHPIDRRHLVHIGEVANIVGEPADYIYNAMVIYSSRSDSPADLAGLYEEFHITGNPTTVRFNDMRTYCDTIGGGITNVQGHYSEIRFTAASTVAVNYVKNYSSSGEHAGSGYLDLWAHYNMGDIAVTGGGGIGTLFGLKINNLTGGWANYSIYTGTASSYFGGYVEVPRILANDATLDIDGLPGTGGGNGGAIIAVSGAGHTNGSGGNFVIRAGAGAGTGDGGETEIYGGESGGGATGNGGQISNVGGRAISTDGNGGNAGVVGGEAAGTGRGGTAYLYGGASAGATGRAGHVEIDAGGPNGGTPGNISIGLDFASAIYIGRAGIATVIPGTTTLNGINYTWPGADAAGVLTSNGGGALSWAATAPATPHNVFSATHGDTTGAASPVDGDLIIGNATPRWSKLAISIPGAGILNYLGVNNGELRPSWKSASSSPGAAAAVLQTTTAGALTLGGAFTMSYSAAATAVATIENTNAGANANAAIELKQADAGSGYIIVKDTGYANALAAGTMGVWGTATGLNLLANGGTMRFMSDETTEWGRCVAGTWRFGAPATDYTAIDADGDITQVGTARIDWTKITADSITLAVGTGTGGVADLRTAHDGLFYKVDEAAATPAIDLIVDFVSVTAFNWVNILAYYAGSATHALAVQLYNWTDARWDTFGAIQNGAGDVATASGYILDNLDFIVPSDTKFIGTGGDAGEVRVRLYHTMAGSAAHDLWVDVVALYH